MIAMNQVGVEESFGRSIKSNVMGSRTVLVRMTLEERNSLRAQANACGLSLQKFCHARLIGSLSGDSGDGSEPMKTPT